MQLNVEQKKLIQAKPNGHLLIKGVAGSGKTTVAVHRIPFLLDHYCFAPEDRILLVTYNKTLVNYFQYLYEKVEEENTTAYQSMFAGHKEKIDIQTIDGILYQYFMKSKKEKKNDVGLLNNNEKYAILGQCLAELCKRYSTVKILNQKNINFLLDEIDWIKSCHYMELEEYQNADRVGRMSNKNAQGPQKLMKNSDTRKAIFDLMLFYQRKLKEQNKVDFKDIALIALKEAKKKVDKKYTHILIDESQDLTRVQLDFLKLLYIDKEYSSIIFIADTAQSIYAHSWLAKGRSFTSIGFDMTGKSNSLSKNYRTTTQIAEAAYSLIEEDTEIVDNENFVKPSLIDRQGEYPVYRFFSTPQKEAEYVISEIKKLTQEITHGNIAIITRKRNQLVNMKEILTKAQIPCNLIDRNEAVFSEDTVKLLTMHSIKGLEFKVIIIIGLDEKTIPFFSYQDLEDQGVQESNERRLLYVGMTRANETLYLTGSGKPSKFIGEINPQYLKLKHTSRIRKYQTISLEDYKYVEEIVDIYSEEEKVRQWVIKELKENYKYPESLIKVEYKVNNFSRVGSVDVAVCIYNNNTLTPYILIETKALGKGVKEGLDQLKSYLSNCATCQYAIVTDGNEIVMINRQFEEIEDIPLFHQSMLPSSIEYYDYMDLRNNRVYEIIQDSDNKDHLTVKSDSERREYTGESLSSIPIYGDIAAGKAIAMNDEVIDNFNLPQEWLKGKEESFMLQIRGDSMIEANIHNGDYVLIEKKSTAQNRDIVAVAIDEDATLKRFMLMGDTVLLIPENHKYEPIQMKSDQVRVLGVALGVVRKKDG